MEYICKYCTKKYKSIQSRSNHYQIYHETHGKSKVSQHKQSKHKHEKICINKDDNKINQIKMMIYNESDKKLI